MPLFGMLSNDLAIDLGTANTLIYMKGKGIILNQPSYVTYDIETKKVLAIGEDAKIQEGRTPRGYETIRPLKDGVIADFEIAEKMLSMFIKQISKNFVPARKIVICVPSGITEVEKRAVRDTAEHAGAKEVFLITEPMSAAIGIGLDVMEPVGNMIIDIGGGTTEIAVISLSRIATQKSIRVAGDELTESIRRYFKSFQNIDIGPRTAEKIKMEVGSAMPLAEEQIIQVKGRDLVSGLPKETEISSIEIREAMEGTIKLMVEAVNVALESTAPELASDILQRGIFLTGGGALIKGLDQRITVETGVPVHVAEDPLTAVVRGTGKVLEELEKYSKVTLRR
ncbi:MAG TPA: rod shape-determining protein [Ignavibacteria bacterium]|nr:rod shape-determining protein [Ignavibacteria bacterium]